MKNFVIDFLRALSAEVLKLKRTLALWLVAIAPLSVVALQFLLFVRPSFHLRGEGDPWMMMANVVFGLWGVLMLPLFITLEAALTGNLEHGEKQWKHLFALPVSRRAIYAAKLAVNFALIGLSSFVLWVAALGSGYLLRFLRPDMGFGVPAPAGWLFERIALIYVAVWLILALHTWLSLRWPGFVFAIGFGMTATVTGFMIANSAHWAKFYPWTLQINVVGTNQSNLRTALAVSVIGAIVVAVAGCWEMTRRDVI